MIVPRPEHDLGKTKEPITFRGANNAIYNKLNFALSLIPQDKAHAQLINLIMEARALADAVVHHPQADVRTFVCFNVLFPHVREINGQQMMLEPLFSGDVWLPYDDDTKAALKRKWLKHVDPKC